MSGALGNPASRPLSCLVMIEGGARWTAICRPPTYGLAEERGWSLSRGRLSWGDEEGGGAGLPGSPG